MLLLLACTSTPEDTGAVATRIAFMADSHVIGPQYECCSESEGLDNESIMKTPERLQAAIQRLNAVDPAPERVFILGDVVHDSHHSRELSWYAEEETGFSRASEMLAELNMPAHPIWGNHDYEVNCGNPDSSYERAFSESVFESYWDEEPWFAVDTGGWRFLAGNSMQGPSWDLEDGRCDTGMASYGEEQLAFIDEQLSEGLPTVFMAHYMLAAITMTGESEEHGDLESVLSAHDNLGLFLAGHTHRWLDFEDHYDFRHIVMAATRYDDDNFWIVDFYEDGSWEIVDYDKAIARTTCADTWLYEGPPQPDPQGVETGDCGY